MPAPKPRWLAPKPRWPAPIFQGFMIDHQAPGPRHPHPLQISGSTIKYQLSSPPKAGRAWVYVKFSINNYHSPRIYSWVGKTRFIIPQAKI